MEIEEVFILIAFLLSVGYAIYLVVKSIKSKEPTKRATPKFHKYQSLDLSKIPQPSKDILKVSIILRQCERWVDTNEHEMASIYYEIIANECKKLSDEHKKSIK